MTAIVGIICRRGLRIELVIETNLIRVSYCCISHSPFFLLCHLKQLYISNKMEQFSYRGGCGICGFTCIEAFKRRVAWAIDKWFWVIGNIMLFQTVIPLRN